MKIKYLFAFLLLFIAVSCAKPSEEERFDKERRQVVHHALKKFISFMKTKGYYAAGIGEGLDHSTEKQNYLGVTFDIESLPDVDFARKIEVEALQDFLNYINAEEGIQDYVAEYPYPLKFVYVAFISRHPELGLLSVSNFRDELSYDKADPETPIAPSITIHEEPYEEAVCILAQQKNISN